MTRKELFKNDLLHIFKSDLKHLYYVEKENYKALHGIVNETIDPDLIDVLRMFLDHSEVNRKRLETIFYNLGIKTKGKKSRGIDGLLQETKEIIEKSEKLTYVIVDAALLSAIHRILFYKLASYKTLKSYSKLLSNNLASELFDKSYREAIKSEKKISRLIVRRVKPETVTLV